MDAGRGEPRPSASTAVCSDDYVDRGGSVLHVQVTVALRAFPRLSCVRPANTSKRLSVYAFL
ncbi:MAG TPA: hypothetical protein VFN35_32010 [Ktedonobacteraceae bacterium]|nr:hypothetical protein [Ktedonobacteraceae bacterium]